MKEKIDAIIDHQMSSFIEHDASEFDSSAKEEFSMDSKSDEQNNVQTQAAMEVTDVSIRQSAENQREKAEQPLTVDPNEPIIPFIAPNVQVVHPIIREPELETDNID